MIARALVIAGLTTGLLSISVAAEEVVKVGGALALLNKPASARAGIILIPGSHGALKLGPSGKLGALNNNQLVRTRKKYMRFGIATLTIDKGVNVAAAVSFMRGISRKVVVVATSRGTLRVAGSLSARPNGVVLTAGLLDKVRAAIGSPAALPATLVVHHRQDGCWGTPPAAVEPFRAWGGGKVQVAWLTGGTSVGNPCKPRSYHGFNGLDGKVVSTVAKFALSVQ